MDDVELDLPACDLLISYARHLDMIEKLKARNAAKSAEQSKINMDRLL